jgi:hypothetical protein
MTRQIRDEIFLLAFFSAQEIQWKIYGYRSAVEQASRIEKIWIVFTIAAK